MIKVLEDAVSKAKQLSEGEQKALAQIVDGFVELRSGQGYQLANAQVEDVRRRVDAANRHEFVSDEAMAALWKRCGL